MHLQIKLHNVLLLQRFLFLEFAGTSFFDEMQAASSAAMALTSNIYDNQEIIKTNGRCIFLFFDSEEPSLCYVKNDFFIL